MSLTPHSGDSEHWFLNSTLFLPLANSPKGAAPAPASTRLNLHRKLHSTRSLIGAAIIAVSPAAGVARAQIVLSPEVSIAVAVVEVPGASPLELAPYQAKAPAAGGHPVIGLSADKGQALFDDVAGMKDAKILCHPTLVSHAGQQGTVSSGQSVNLSGGTPPVFAGITIDLTPQVSPKGAEDNPRRELPAGPGLQSRHDLRHVRSGWHGSDPGRANPRSRRPRSRGPGQTYPRLHHSAPCRWSGQTALSQSLPVGR